MDISKINEEMKRDEFSSEPVYYQDGGEFFAEDIYQQMTVLPEVVTPTHKNDESKWSIQASQELMIKRS